MSIAEPSRSITRRGILAASFGTIGAVMAATLGRTTEALGANGDTVKVGHSFTGTSPTTIEDTSMADNKNGLVGRAHADKSAGLRGDNTGAGDGVFGTSNTGVGVHAKVSNGVAVKAEGGPGAAIIATSSGGLPTIVAENTNGEGVAAVSVGGVGVTGSSSNSAGVLGMSTGGPGVLGSTSSSIDYTNLPRSGVVGQSGSHIGGYFSSDTGTALKVDGRVEMSRSGRFQCSAGVISKLITVPGVTSKSLVLANIQQNRPGLYIRAVVPGTDEFTLHFNEAPIQDTVIGYLVLN